MEQEILNKNVINFFFGKKEYRSLSNFWLNDIIIIDVDTQRIYESGEHCFHGEKYYRLGQHSEDKERKQKLLDYSKIFIKPSQYKTGATVKKNGGKKGLLLNNEELKLWNDISIDVQKEICKWKINNYEEVRQDLLKSDNKILIHLAMRCSQEKLQNCIWNGKAVIVDRKIVILGKNLLGNIWIKYREKYIISDTK
jgi:predicted NAD-dependent protein-ADP-ribosyltransferase YbiA (DUF1768 family)